MKSLAIPTRLVAVYPPALAEPLSLHRPEPLEWLLVVAFSLLPLIVGMGLAA
ncbi:MAG: hypothetical protein ACI841_003488 [Planctomycetota bacterium]|jgi:hypothetical protein